MADKEKKKYYHPGDTFIPPHHAEMEEAVLGSVMLHNNVFAMHYDLFFPELFYKEINVWVYRAIKELHDKSKPIDILTVTDTLRDLGKLDFVGGAWYISKLTGRIASAANIEHHLTILKQLYIQRKMRDYGFQLIAAVEDNSTSFEEQYELMNKIPLEIGNIFLRGRKKTKTNASVINEIISDIEKIKKGELTGLPTGFIKIDRHTGGLQGGDLILLAARPAMGKTALVTAIAKRASYEQKRKGLAFMLEMTHKKIMIRMLSEHTGIKAVDFRHGTVDIKELQSKIKPLDEDWLMIDDTSFQTIEQIKTTARLYKMEHDIEYIVIDYLQLATAKDIKNREQEISKISRELKALAKELNIPIIALSQLSRAVETRGGDKVPQLSDLRESGSLEQDADMVWFIHRPEYYGILEDAEGEPTDGLAHLIIAKFRDGSTGTIDLGWDKEYVKFLDEPKNKELKPLSSNYPHPDNLIESGKGFDDDLGDDAPF